MSLRSICVLMLALVCGVSAAVGMNRLQRLAPSGSLETIPVVVAKIEIPRGCTVGAEMLEVRDWPKSMASENVISTIDEAVDRAAVVQILAGDLVLAGKLASKDAGHGLAPLIPTGMRAYTIQTSKLASNVAGFVLPHNRVDVLLTLKSHDVHDASGGGTSTTLLQNVEILAVDQQLDAPSENRTVDMRSVTLLVTPKQAGFLDLGQNLGELTLSLRNPSDTLEGITVPATVADLRFRQEPVELTKTDAVATAEVEPKPAMTTFKIRTLRGSYAGEVPVSGRR